jgi:hypothetical protein
MMLVIYNFRPRLPILIALPFSGQDNIGPGSDAKFVDSIAPLPRRTPALDYGNQLLRNSLCKTSSSASHVPPLGCIAHDPLYGCPPSLSLAEWNRNLKRDATTSSTSLTSNAHERRDRVYGKREVQNRVKRQVRRRRCPREEGFGRVDGGDR